MATETLFATSLVSGTVTTSANALGAANGVFTTDTGATSWTARFAIGDPTGTQANGTHTVTIPARKVAGQSGTPVLNSIALYVSSVLIQTNTLTTSITNTTTGQSVSTTFASSLLVGADLTGLEIEVVTTAAGGGTTARTPVQIDSITWSGDFTTVINQNVTAPAATGTAATVAPTLQADSNVSAPAATATADGVAPTVSADFTATTTAAAATASTLVPTVTADSTITVPAATATAAAPAATPSSDATISPPPATATAAGLAATVTGGGGSGVDANVSAPAATATATGVAATVSAAAILAPPAAAATASAPVPVLSAGASVTVTPATAVAAGLPADFGDGLSKFLPSATLVLTATTHAFIAFAAVPPADLRLSIPVALTHRAVLLTTRWTFYDPLLNETWVMPINPDSEGNPLRAKGMAFGRNARSGGRFTTVRAVPRPLEWEFAGVIRTQAHHDALNDWAGRRRIIHVTDHIGRTYEVMLTAYEATERAPTKSGLRWRLRYSMKALLLRQLA